VVLSLLELTLKFELLGKVMVSVLQQVNSEFLDKSDHLVVHLGLLVHVDGKIRFISSQIHLFSFLVMGFLLEFSSFVNLDFGVLTLGEISGNDKLSLIPFVGSNIHLECLNILSCVDEILLSEVKLTNFSVVLGNLSVVRSCNFGLLVLHKLDGSVPFSGGKSGLDSLVEDISLDEVLNGQIELLLGDQPVTPFFFKRNN
jgi:hypothetical protein